MNAQLLKLGLAVAALWFVMRPKKSNACAGREDGDVCGPGMLRCLKGKCIEFAKIDHADVSVGDEVEDSWTKSLDVGAWIVEGLDALNAASEQIIDYGNAIISPSDPRLDEEGPITSPNDSRLGMNQ